MKSVFLLLALFLLSHCKTKEPAKASLSPTSFPLQIRNEPDLLQTSFKLSNKKVVIEYKFCRPEETCPSQRSDKNSSHEIRMMTSFISLRICPLGHPRTCRRWQRALLHLGKGAKKLKILSTPENNTGLRKLEKKEKELAGSKLDSFLSFNEQEGLTLISLEGFGLMALYYKSLKPKTQEKRQRMSLADGDPPTRGLENFGPWRPGNTCFANAGLQLLLSVTKNIDDFKSISFQEMIAKEKKETEYKIKNAKEIFGFKTEQEVQDQQAKDRNKLKDLEDVNSDLYKELEEDFKKQEELITKTKTLFQELQNKNKTAIGDGPLAQFKDAYNDAAARAKMDSHQHDSQEFLIQLLGKIDEEKNVFGYFEQEYKKTRLENTEDEKFDRTKGKKEPMALFAVEENKVPKESLQEIIKKTYSEETIEPDQNYRGPDNNYENITEQKSLTRIIANEGEDKLTRPFLFKLRRDAEVNAYKNNPIGFADGFWLPFKKRGGDDESELQAQKFKLKSVSIKTGGAGGGHWYTLRYDNNQWWEVNDGTVKLIKNPKDAEKIIRTNGVNFAYEPVKDETGQVAAARPWKKVEEDVQTIIRTEQRQLPRHLSRLKAPVSRLKAPEAWPKQQHDPSTLGAGKASASRARKAPARRRTRSGLGSILIPLAIGTAAGAATYLGYQATKKEKLSNARCNFRHRELGLIYCIHWQGLNDDHLIKVKDFCQNQTKNQFKSYWYEDQKGCSKKASGLCNFFAKYSRGAKKSSLYYYHDLKPQSTQEKHCHPIGQYQKLSP